MSFKSISLKALIGLCLIFSGCSDYLSSGKVRKQTVKINKEDYECIQKIPVIWSKYFSDQSVPGEVAEIATCIDHSISSYKMNVSGVSEDSYSKEDIRSFLNFFYFEGIEIDNHLVADFFRLKRILVGGNEDVVTTQELTQISEVMRSFTEEMELVRPSIGIITLKRMSEPSSSEINFALLSVRDSLMRFLGKTKILQWEVDVREFTGLINHFKEWNHRYYGNQWVDDRSDSSWFRLLNSVYGVIEGDKRIAGEQEWGEFLNSLSKLYRPVIYKHYFVREGKWKQRRQIRNVETFIFGIIDFIETSPLMVRQGGIEFKYVDELLESIYEIYPHELGVSKKSMMKGYKALISKKISSLDDPMRGNWNQIDKVHIKIIKRELTLWRNIQNFINGLKYEPNFEYTTGWISQINVQKAFEEYQGPTLGEFGNILNRSWPTMVDDDGHLIVDQDMHLKPYTWNSLSFINLTRAMSRFLMLGYGHLESGSHTQDNIEYLDLWNAQLLLPELIEWFNDFNDLGVEIKAFDPSLPNSGGRTFREINFFTFSGNGDSIVDLNELHEYLTGVFAAGANSLREMREGAVKAGCQLSELDIFHEHFLDEKCFKKYLQKDLGTLFSSLVRLKRLRYASQLFNETDQSWEFFYNSLMNGARVPESGINRIGTADMRNFIMMMQYSEIILIYFDTDRDGFLNKTELLRASKRFFSFLKEATCKDNEVILSEGFTHLILRGELPTGWALTEFWFSGVGSDLKNWGIDKYENLRGSYGARDPLYPGGEKPVGREQIYNVFSLMKLRLQDLVKNSNHGEGSSAEGLGNVCPTN